MNTFINALLLVGMAIALSFVWPEMEDHHAENEQAKQALKDLRMQERFETAAQDVCGPNATWIDLGDNAIQCLSKHAKKTVKVQM